ncbi:MAG TPA: 3-phosphoshikimate 1-carboxyvinyltransferase [Pyrinomonadaceae bacterium]|nr:3-phosphoshikimate 1-carboxyvinyltransferase [Pyrinomonadaceae bacterium]
MKIRAARRLRGHLQSMPGDKSISHRAAIIAALARGHTVISNYSTSADCASTLSCLEQLGVRVTFDGNTVAVEGAGTRPGAPFFRAPDAVLDCGNSGSTMRMLAGVLAAQPFASTLAGDASLNRRPMKRIIEPLELMGARISSDDGHAPLGIEGVNPPKPIRYLMPVASAQVKSCVLLAGLAAHGHTSVLEPPTPTRDHTERMLQWFGLRVQSQLTGNADGPDSRSVTIEGPATLVARDVDVPGDISSAAFLVAAAALLPGSELELDGVGLNPTRARILSTLESLGAKIEIERAREECNEPVGDIRVRGGARLAPVKAGDGANVLRGESIAQLIDELPVLAVLGSQVEGGLEIRDAGELRVKESDRISATVENLRAMGARVEEFDDGMRIEGGARLRGARLDSYGDHRIAMAFTVAALVAEGETEIEGAEECVGVSFPDFFSVLESLTER